MNNLLPRIGSKDWNWQSVDSHKISQEFTSLMCRYRVIRYGRDSEYCVVDSFDQLLVRAPSSRLAMKFAEVMEYECCNIDC